MESKEIEKTQRIRLIDVFLIAPFLMMISNKKKLSDAERTGLKILSLSTFIYNGLNYLKNEAKAN